MNWMNTETPGKPLFLTRIFLLSQNYHFMLLWDDKQRMITREKEENVPNMIRR